MIYKNKQEFHADVERVVKEYEKEDLERVVERTKPSSTFIPIRIKKFLRNAVIIGALAASLIGYWSGREGIKDNLAPIDNKILTFIHHNNPFVIDEEEKRVNAQNLCARAENYLGRGKIDEATAALEEANQLGTGLDTSELESRIAQNLCARAENLLEQGKPNEATAALEEANQLGTGLDTSELESRIQNAQEATRIEQANGVPLGYLIRDELTGYATISPGDPIMIYNYNLDGTLKWTEEIAHGMGLVPKHLAPIDYNKDGCFNELLIEVSGSTNKPGVITLLSAEASIYNFLILDSEKNMEYQYQCGHITSQGFGRLECSICSQEEANAIYRDKLQEYGYFDGEKFLDRSY